MTRKVRPLSCLVTTILVVLSLSVTAANAGTLGEGKIDPGFGLLDGGVHIPASYWTVNEICGHWIYLLIGYEETSTWIWTSLGAVTSPYNGKTEAEGAAGSYSTFEMGIVGFASERTTGTLATASNGAVYMNAELAEWTLYSIYCKHPYSGKEFDSGYDTSWVTDWEPLGYAWQETKSLAPQGTKSHKHIATRFYFEGYWSNHMDLRYKAANFRYGTTGIEDPQAFWVEGINRIYLHTSVSVSFGAYGVSVGTDVLKYEVGIKDKEKYIYWFYPGGEWFIDYLAHYDDMLWAFDYIEEQPPNPPIKPSCVWVSTWNGTEYVDENNLLPQSQVRDYSSNLTMTDRYILQEQPANEDGNYTIRLREFVEERDVIDKASLWAIYHDEDVGIATDPDGNVWTFIPDVASSAISAQNSLSDDVLDQINHTDDNKSYEGAGKGDYVILTFNKAAYQETGWLVIRSKSFIPEKRPIPCTIPGQINEVDCGDVPSRSNWFYEILDIGDEIPFTSGTTFQVKLYVEPSQHLDYATFQNEQTYLSLMVPVPLGRATDDNNTDVTFKLASVDKEYVYLTPGENITMVFNGTSLPPPLINQTVDFLVQADGFYLPAITLLEGEAGRILTKYYGQDVVVTPYLYDYDGYVNITWSWDNETSGVVSDVLRIEDLGGGEHEVRVSIRFQTNKILLRTVIEIPE